MIIFCFKIRLHATWKNPSSRLLPPISSPRKGGKLGPMQYFDHHKGTRFSKAGKDFENDKKVGWPENCLLLHDLGQILMCSMTWFPPHNSSPYFGLCHSVWSITLWHNLFLKSPPPVNLVMLARWLQPFREMNKINLSIEVSHVSSKHLASTVIILSLTWKLSWASKWISISGSFLFQKKANTLARPSFHHCVDDKKGKKVCKKLAFKG